MHIAVCRYTKTCHVGRLWHPTACAWHNPALRACVQAGVVCEGVPLSLHSCLMVWWAAVAEAMGVCSGTNSMKGRWVFLQASCEVAVLKHDFSMSIIV